MLKQRTAPEENTFAKNAHITYRPDIDGLRAIAVLAILLFHIFPTVLPGGFVGVDIFFVISGYLITAIILTDLEKKRFKFSDFYSRRIKRIFPALILVLLFVIVLGWFVLFPSEYSTLGKHIRYAVTFLTNLRFYKEAGYFDASADYKPLLHIWSLSLEEQFYIIFPLCVYLIYKLKRYGFILIAITAIASFSLNVMVIQTKPAAAFYFLSTRAWELLLGSLLAYVMVLKTSSGTFNVKEIYTLNKITQNSLAIIGLCLIIYACVTFDSNDIFPGWLALLPTLGACCLIIAQDTWLNRQILSSTMFVFIGLISYPLYLWHWPLISFARIMKGSEVDMGNRLFIFIGSFILAAATTYLLENPIRKAGPKIILPLILFMIAIFLISIPIKKNDLMPFSVAHYPIIEKIDFAMNDLTYPTKNLNKIAVNKFYQYGKGSEKIVFFGDSNMAQYWPRVEKLMQDNQNLYRQYTVIFATRGGQIPLLEIGDLSYRNNFLTLMNDPSVKTVIFGAQWLRYFSEDSATNEKRYHDIENLLLNIKQKGAKIYLILNIPMEPQQAPLGMVERHLISPWKFNTDKSYHIDHWLSRSQNITDHLRNIAEKTGVTIIDPVASLCPGGQCIILEEDGMPIYKDISHLSSHYVRANATFIDQVFSNT